ncbi:MAG: SoxR reducing system RseC family protein, partial [Spirochaetales bacterium]|nr:SoxR reducing system RseC family protein [Spirochaetales bacterium]
EARGSCSSGDCASCSSKGKSKLIQAINIKNLPLKPGSVIEMELPTGKALIAAFRVLIVPLLLFITAFTIVGNIPGTGEGLQVASGFLGLFGGFFLNFLFSKKYKMKEMPEIIRIL